MTRWCGLVCVCGAGDQVDVVLCVELVIRWVWSYVGGAGN